MRKADSQRRRDEGCRQTKDAEVKSHTNLQVLIRDK